MTTCTDNTKYTTDDVETDVAGLEGTINNSGYVEELQDLDREALARLKAAALMGAQVPGLEEQVRTLTNRATLAEEQRTQTHQQVAEIAKVLDPEVTPDAWGCLEAAQKRMRELSALHGRVDALEGQVDSTLGVLKERLLDAFPEAEVPAIGERFRGKDSTWSLDSVRALAEHVASLAAQVPTLRAQVATLTADRDEAVALHSADAKAWVTLHNDAKREKERAESERDALRAQVKRVLEAHDDYLTSLAGEEAEAMAERDVALEDLRNALSALPAETTPEEWENTCEHGDHAAPAGQRFCSLACQRCEAESINPDDEGCSGVCGRGEEAANSPAVSDGSTPTAEPESAAYMLAARRWHAAVERAASNAAVVSRYRAHANGASVHPGALREAVRWVLHGDVPVCGEPSTVQGNCKPAANRMLSALDVRPTVPPLLERPPEADPYVARVTEFHESMGLPVRHVPDVGTLEERVLGGGLILEESLEFLGASGLRVRVGSAVLRMADLVVEVDPDSPGPDLAAMLHELGDCQVVVAGRAVQFGLPLLAAVSEEIHPANMRKLGPDGRPVRRADGKVIKPAGWVPADVSRVLRRAQEGRPTLPQRIDSSLAKLGHELTPMGRLMASEVDAMLHPSGRCTCAGEGQCEWCRARCDACGGPSVPESVRRAVVRVWSALRVTTPEQGAAVAVLRAVFQELPVPDGDEGREAVKLLTRRMASRVQGSIGMRKPPDALSYQDVVLMAQACKAALSDMLDRHDLPEPVKELIALVHNNLVDVWQGVAHLQDLAGSAMVKAVQDAARLGAEDMRERAALRLESSASEESATTGRATPETYSLSHQMALKLELEALAIRDLPLPGDEVPRG
ncbi:hypothetical protein [Corallococcus sp. AS-1-6]|uniref:hypothetical protein n=1 Tax=Corallococcus sp. AS-1-6 TaxID=2874599 RepID=UPI001CBC98DF|nr:hypothetical protein [Corallococcus sp. AS-1-6]MBZ4371498.1 hypothetical protein [Corallococcus sp. AS-1-6]